MPTLGKTKVSPSLISTGSLFEGTSSYAVTASYAMNGGSGGSGGAVQTGSIANQTVLYNVTTSQDNVITGLNLSNNKWGISVVEEWNSGSVPGDIYYNSCSLLMHFSGSNGSTTFTDNSPSPKTITANNGVSISTAQSKFGGTSGLFDGTDDYLNTPSSADFDFGTGDFTVEFWFNPSSLGGNAALVGTRTDDTSTTIRWCILATTDAGINVLACDIWSTSDARIALFYHQSQIPTGQWTHCALVRYGTSFKLYQNGVQSTSGATTSAPVANSSTVVNIGSFISSAVLKFNGYMDELRITKGVARYTGSFTPQTSAFPDTQGTIPQYETKYIGLIGGLNDSTVDYGVEKLSDSSLKIRKMSASGQPLSGSGQLSASVDRVYVNVLNYDNVSISGSISNAISSSYSLTASYNLNSVSSSFANTSSYSLNTISSSYSNVANTATSATSATSANTATSSSYATVAGSATSATSATSANTANSATSASYSLSSSFATNAVTATSATSSTSANTANSATSASYSLSSSYSVNSNTSISSSFSSTASYNLNSISSSFSTTSSYNLNSVSSSYALTASFALNSAGGGGTTLTTGSTYPITSSWAINAITASYALNASGGGSGGSTQTGSIANQTILYNVTTSQDNVISGLNLSSNKWGVTVVEEWNSGSIVGDEYYSSCSLLMHFSGSNGSTTFIDNSPSPKTATSNNGASISTVQSKFGGTSGLFDGTDDYVTVPDNSEFDFGAGDFTIEYWEYRTASTGDKPTISRNNSGPGPWMLGWSAPGGIAAFYASTNGGSWDIANGISMGLLTTNVWTHYAVTRQGNTFRTFQNGIQISTFTSAATIYAGAGPLQIGRYNTTSLYPGYLDELRLTKGVARYTGNFVTQSAEFYNNASVSQLQTKYIGLVGGLNDSNVDYGVEKLSDSSLKIRKMTASGQPLSGSGALSASVDKVYVNVLDYTNVMVTSSYALTASYVLGGIQTGSISNQTILYSVTTSQENTITGLDLSGNKWDVSVIEEWDAKSITGGDQYYPSCSLLLHFSGSNGSTTFTDNSPTPKTITANGNVQISTAQSKFGGSSAYYDGTGDYLSISTISSSLTNDFTIECWIYIPVTNISYPVVVESPGPFYIRFGDSGFGYKLQFSINESGFSNIYSTAYTQTSLVNQWVHLALTRASSTVRFFVNGVIQSLGTGANPSSYPVTSFVDSSTISSNNWVVGNTAYNGYIDEFRITNGVARYTANFTPQTSEFPNSQFLTQLQTKYVGLVGGLNDTGSDYGVQKLSDGSLKIRKMSVSGTPVSGSETLSASVDRVYVNVLNYKEVQTTAQSASYAVSSSYLINASAGESFHPFLLG